MEYLILYGFGALGYLVTSLLLSGFKLQELNVTVEITQSIFWLFHTIHNLGAMVRLAYGIITKEKDKDDK